MKLVPRAERFTHTHKLMRRGKIQKELGQNIGKFTSLSEDDCFSYFCFSESNPMCVPVMDKQENEDEDEEDKGAFRPSQRLPREQYTRAKSIKPLLTGGEQ